MKKFSKTIKMFSLSLVVLLVAVTTVFAASTASGSFSLTYGRWSRTAEAKTEARYPYMKYTSQLADGGVVDATLSKVGLLSFDNKQRIFDISIDGNNKVTYALFNQYSPATYVVTTVETAEDGVANASYLFTSKSHSGTP